MAKATAILYQSAGRDITLIDVPTSIAVAQGRSAILRSCEPLEEPYKVMNEPKTAKAREQLAGNTVSPELHAAYREDIEMALTELRRHVSGPWCAPRKLMTPGPKARNNDMDIDDPEKELTLRLHDWSKSKGGDDVTKLMASLGLASESNATSNGGPVTPRWIMSYRAANDHARSHGSDAADETWESSFHNPNDPLELVIRDAAAYTEGTREYRFYIPSVSTLFLKDVAEPEMFRRPFRQLTDDYALPRHFNLILVDPPWPNHSAKRSAEYYSPFKVKDVKRQILQMDLDTYMEYDCLVGVWITNKPSARNAVLGEHGLFRNLNVGLIEEWIWVKTTSKGEPVFSMESILRKPYEVLLLGRAAPDSWTTMKPAAQIKRRIIAGVPDLHSRKPCLKELLEPFMPDPTDYSALEIFSRYLVKGWTSWGNEVLKFNWSEYWASSVDDCT